ncbi:hypothetical protein ES703_54019 [subsurface metagenome]
MYLLYLDESGDPYTWGNCSHFTLGGIAIYEGQIRQLTNQLDQIQTSFFPGISVSIPFHASAIRAGKGQFRSLGKGGQGELLHAIYQVIQKSRFPNLIAFATVAHISYVQDPQQVLHDVFQDVCQRFNTFLMRFAKQGKPEKGLLIIDRAHEDHYRRLIAEFQKAGTRHGYIGNIVDIPYFAGCHNTRMLQIADHCAYATFRRYENNDPTYFKMIIDAFDKRSPNKPDGLKHLTTNRNCTCEACNWRRP